MDYLRGHGALIPTIKIKDITSDKNNKAILHRIKNNDPSFCKIHVTLCPPGATESQSVYCATDAFELEWLGHFIGRNKHLKKLVLRDYPEGEEAVDNNFSRQIASLHRGVSQNTSIKVIAFEGINLFGNELSQLSPFFASNSELIRIKFEICSFMGESADQFASILENRATNTLNCFELLRCVLDDDSLAEIFGALRIRPQPELIELNLSCSTFGRKSHMELSNLLRLPSLTRLQKLNLFDIRLNDTAIDLLTFAIADNGQMKIRTLDISLNPSITPRGYRALSTLLERQNCNLEVLDLSCNNICDEGIISISRSLVKNRSLVALYLGRNPGISAARGWAAISHALCDTSSVNGTFLSNHTLQHVHNPCWGYMRRLPSDLLSSLKLNKNRNKKQVAINKILMHHDELNMNPFFKWELKMLPLVIEWFDRANDCERISKASLKEKKLSAIFQVVSNMPQLVAFYLFVQELRLSGACICLPMGT
mmetsp:Transcript_5066/g.11034  ORF Transcript_5066/g.11034 Transcript_5066/m.11034 type:complete len:482 (-) Transcript_5066:263-1708(-)|eukprot:CAMPEP_0183746762 /NCGR_PEP_ID=MMETSP0737-20130205/66922_1 /TAXON_ID=385413 /ORGANISM="Thalassiosira miniscula, Strain CCMP1093" /LENGTH=481 /DNA_ID=CAMNT_0025982467 /DNA_START=1177 /DNA_END=2622 /DNA_ORIENTATION=+